MVAFIGGIGGWEILFILALALVIFGPKRLPELARSLGKISAQIRMANRQLQRELYDNLDPEEVMREPALRTAHRQTETEDEAESDYPPPPEDERPPAREPESASETDAAPERRPAAAQEESEAPPESVQGELDLGGKDRSETSSGAPSSEADC